jgi:Fe-S-cluster containining protein
MKKLDCKNCDGRCCKYVVIEIDSPKTINDFEDIKWYVCHKNINVFCDSEDSWHVEFITPCTHLGKGNICKIYSKRPKICKDYSQEECTFHNKYSEKLTFKNIKDVEEYIKKKFKK